MPRNGGRSSKSSGLRWSDPQRSCECQQLAALMLATQPLCEGLLRVRPGRSLWSSRTPAPPSPADIATDNQVVALGPQNLCTPAVHHRNGTTTRSTCRHSERAVGYDRLPLTAARKPRRARPARYLRHPRCSYGAPSLPCNDGLREIAPLLVATARPIRHRLVPSRPDEGWERVR
jgi:hypothetical protein